MNRRLGRWILTARTPSTLERVLRLSLLAVAVHCSLLATRAHGFLRADASSLTAAAGCWDCSSCHVDDDSFSETLVEVLANRGDKKVGSSRLLCLRASYWKISERIMDFYVVCYSYLIYRHDGNCLQSKQRYWFGYCRHFGLAPKFASCTCHMSSVE